MKQNQRSIKNWLISPNIKLKYVFLSICFGGFSIVLFQTLFITWINTEDGVIIPRFTFFLLAYFCLCVLFGIWMSHQFIGPMVAFSRHIKELAVGNYTHKTHLRKGDEFTEFMNELNSLSDTLQNHQKPQA